MGYFDWSFRRKYDPNEALGRPYRKPLFNISPVEEAEEPMVQRPRGISSFYQDMMNLDPLQEEQAYLDWLKKSPKEADYAPSKGTRLAAALVGAAHGFLGDPGLGLQTANIMTRTPYERALKAHELEGRGLKESALIAAKRRDDMIQLAQANEKAQLDAAKFELDLQNTMSLIQSRGVSSDLAKERMKLIRNQAALSGIVEIEDKRNGTIQFFNRLTQQYVGEPIKVDETINQKETRGRARFTFEEGQRQSNRVALEDKRQSGREKLQEDRQRFDADQEGRREVVQEGRDKTYREFLLQRDRLREQNRVGRTDSVATKKDKVMGAVLREPEKYPIKKLFNKDKNGNYELKSKDDVSKEYQSAWEELYSIRFGASDEEIDFDLDDDEDDQ